MARRRRQAYSDDPRGRVLDVSEPSRAVAARFGVSVSCMIKARQCQDRHGGLSVRPHASRTRRLLTGLHDLIVAHVRANDAATLNELRAWLREAHGMSVSMSQSE